jgi:hypothetical protein
VAEQARDADPLVERVDALMRRHKSPAKPEADVPVLTEIVDDADVAAAPPAEEAALAALAEQLERSLVERLAPEVERMLEEATHRLSGEVNANLQQLVREAVASTLARALERPKGE